MPDTWRIHIYVDQSESPVAGLEPALGAVVRHLKAHEFYSYVFTLASYSDRLRRVVVTVKSNSERLKEFAGRKIPQDFPVHEGEAIFD
jgi:hypothetical protein